LKRKQKYISDGNKQMLAETCNKLGNFYMNENDFEKALLEFKEEESIYKENLNTDNAALQYAKANRMISEVYILQGKFSQALKHINVYLKIAKSKNDMPEIQRAFCTLGRCLLLQGMDRIENNNDEGALSLEDFKSAERWFLKSLIKCKE
jgi:NF-kappa-B inhibitor-like protein 2